MWGASNHREATARAQRSAVSHAALAPEVLAQIKGIQIRAQRLVTDVMAGEYESAFKGRGMEPEEVRDYLPGDDIRHIDWKVTARMATPYIKVHREERELTVMLLVDMSSSEAFGSGTKLKSDVAAEVAALLAYLALKSNDRVGLIIFSDRIEHYVPPKKGRGHVWQVLRDILTFRAEHRATDLSGALEYLGKVVRRRCVAFVISDFLPENLGLHSATGDDRFSETLRVSARRHDITAISITDPREVELPPVGMLELEDAETGEVVLVDALHAATRDGFRVLGQRQRQQRDTLFRTAGIGHIPIHTERSYVDPIMRYFRLREARA